MFDEIIACLDGSSLAEKILPLARGVTATREGRLTLLRIVQDTDELAAEEEYLRDCARQYSAELRFRVSSDPAGAIVAELERDPRAIAALTTHGRTAWAEAVLGSVALRVNWRSKTSRDRLSPCRQRARSAEENQHHRAGLGWQPILGENDPARS